MPPATSHGKFADSVRALRKHLKEDQTTFGTRFDCSGRTIDNWEQGHREPDRRAKRLLDALRAIVDAESAQQTA